MFVQTKLVNLDALDTDAQPPKYPALKLQIITKKVAMICETNEDWVG